MKTKDLSKSRVKKLRRDWERQKKLHEAWIPTWLVIKICGRYAWLVNSQSRYP